VHDIEVIDSKLRLPLTISHTVLEEEGIKPSRTTQKSAPTSSPQPDNQSAQRI